MPRFFIESPLAAGQSIELPEAVCRHVQVLRLAPGDVVTLFDGSGGEYEARIDDIGKKRVAATLGAHLAVERESPLAITLVQAVSSGDRMDYTLQKAVELGVTAIVPVISERSVVRLSGERADKRVQHWQGVVQSACEQCGRNRVPSVAPLLSFDGWLRGAQPAGMRFMLSPQGRGRLRELSPVGELALLAGPEGGLTAAEEAAALVSGWQPLLLGPRILRTETAAVATIAALQALWGDV